MPSYERTLDIKLQSSEPAEIREGMIEFIRWHRNWYRKSSYTYGFFWNLFTLGIILLSASAAMLTALDLADDYKITSVIISSTSALFGTLLAQFRVRDLWQVREAGRVDCQSLLTEALAMPVDTEMAARDVAMKLRASIVEIERDQASRFFAQPVEPQNADKIGS